jgi:hypothetical protein
MKCNELDHHLAKEIKGFKLSKSETGNNVNI